MRLSVCALFQKEAPYLREWIAFHQMVGVEHFYLYNDDSTDDWQSAIEGLENISVIDFSLKGRRQMDAYQHAINRLRGNDEYMAVIDVDEFLWSPKYETLQEAIDTVAKPWGALGVQWMCFGSSGKTEYENLPVIERFTWRTREDSYFNQWMKCIVDLRDPGLSPGYCDPHRFQTSWGTVNEKGNLTCCPTQVHSSEVLRINHYFTKSRPEWQERHPVNEPILGGHYPRDEARWIGVQAMEVDDREIQRFLPELKRRLQ